MSSMYLIIGLGNPTAEYARTRHNIGFQVVERLVERLASGQVDSSAVVWHLHKKCQAEVVKVSELVIAKPQTYMNASGQAVQALMKFYQIESLSHLYVFHDDLDIAVGSYKFHLGRGPKVHNGLTSIYQSLGAKEFWHGRIGVDGRQPGQVGQFGVGAGADYVLSQFRPDEQPLITEVIETALTDLQTRLGLSI